MTTRNAEDKPIVYVVTDGDYSDYHIEAIFSDEDAAHAFTEKCGGRVEPWPIDDVPNLRGDKRQTYDVWMTYEGTTIGASCYGTDCILYALRPEPESKPLPGPRHLCVLATDKEHAVKIANERRAQLIANGTWITKEEYTRRQKARKKGKRT